MPALTVAQLAEICNGTAEGDTQREIDSVNTIEEAAAHQLSFVANRKASLAARASRAGCLLVTADFDNSAEHTVVRVKDARAAFARAISFLHPSSAPAPGIHPTAAIAATATIGSGCYIGPHVSIGEHASLGNACIINAGCAINAHVIIGNACLFYPNVTIYDRVRIGSRVVLHAGCVIGADGFGFAFTGDRYEKFPQIGSVEIGNDVELGANTCVDRAALGVTRIGDGTKLDNLVHVAHNCSIGRHVVVAAQTGFSGGVTIGDRAVVGGQVGVGDKAAIESGAIVGSGAGILTSKVVHAGEPVWGTPARPLKQYLKQLAALAKLPEALAELRELTRRVADLEGR